MRVPIATVHDPLSLSLVLRLTMVGLAWLALFPITSVDAYYHLATGRRILDSGAIPRVGVGSATFGDRPWHDNEWGFQVVAASLARAEMDETGVWVLTPGSRTRLIALRALCLGLTLAVLAAHMGAAGVDALTRSVGLVLAAFLTFGNLFWTLRPQIFGYLLLAVTAWLVERDRAAKRGSAAALLAVVALWANVHGTFVVGIGLLATEAVGEWLDVARRRNPVASRARARRLTVVTLLSPAAACLNPHGYHQLLHPFLYLFRPEIYRGNAEWTSPDFLHLPLLVATAALLVVSLVARGSGRSADVLRCALFFVLAGSAIRHLPLAAIVWVPILAAGLTAAASRGGRLRRLLPTGPDGRRMVARLASAGAIVAVIVLLSGAKFVGVVPRFDERPVSPMPEREVRRIASHRPPGTIFNSYRFGGFLMFRLYPQDVVFMDGRNDLYRSFRDDVYNPILTAGPGWRSLWSEAVREHDIRWVLVDESDESERLAAELRSDPAWQIEDFGSAGGDRGSGVVLLSRRRPQAPPSDGDLTP